MGSPPTSGVLGQYAVVKTIGEGSFGKVKLGIHTLTNQKVAMKFISKRQIAASRMRHRVQREIEYLRLLEKHPHIIKLYEVINTPTDIIMIIEYAGNELFDYIVKNGSLGEPAARRFFQQMMYALAHAHTLKVVHRDIKPENVLLDDDLNVKLADFGLSSDISDGYFLETSCGSPNYAAPEVIAGKLYAGPEIDVWSTGVILYVMLCGRLPFEDDDVPALFHKITSGVYHMPNYLSQDAKSLVAGMLTVDPMYRLTVPDILAHPWTNVDLAPYLRRTQRQLSARAPLDSLSSLLREGERDAANPDSFIPGIGKVDEGVIQTLATNLGVTVVDIKTALASSGDNAVKVAYALGVDGGVGRELIAIGEADEADTRSIAEPVWIPTSTPRIPGPTDVRRPVPVDEDDLYASDHSSQDYGEEGDYSEFDEESDTMYGEIDWSEENNFAVLDSSLMGLAADPGPDGPKKLFGPRAPHLTSYANSRSAASSRQRLSPSSPSGARSPRSHRAHRQHHPRPPKWHFGIRSSSPPMEVMLEIYRTLQTLGIEWRQKRGMWGPRAEYGAFREREKLGIESDEYGGERDGSDIYLVESRWRIRDVVILMDLQLYQVEAGSYLVDFRDMGCYKASTSPSALSRFERDSSLSNPDPSDEPKPGTPGKKGCAANAFMFLECACRLIVELAGGG